MLNLSEITVAKAPKPPRIVLYGPPKIGKTTFVSQIPGVIIADIEGGSGQHAVARIDKSKLTTLPQFMEAIYALYQQNHSFTTFAVDTIDWLENLIFSQVASEANVRTIDDIGYGKGYATAQNLWRQTLEALDKLVDDRGMAIVLLAHSQIRKYSDPMRDSYDIYSLKLHEKDKGSSSASIIKEWSDCILFANQEVITHKEDAGFNKKVVKAKTGTIKLHTIGQPSFLAGNRYGLPAELPFTWEAFSNAYNEATK